MPRQKNEMYGKKYKACPCAQVVRRDTAYNIQLIEPTCYSPLRGHPQKISRKDLDQVRMCIGGTAKGKKYTQCPYYVRSAQTGKKSVVRKSTLAGLLTDLMLPVVFFYIAYLLLKQGDGTSIAVAVIIALFGGMILYMKFKR